MQGSATTWAASAAGTVAPKLINNRILDGKRYAYSISCGHRTLCRSCAERCKNCPICRVSMKESSLLYHIITEILHLYHRLPSLH